MAETKLDFSDESLKIPPASSPVEIAPPQDDMPQNRLMLVLFGVAALALAILIVLTARWAVHRSTNNTTSQATNSSSGFPKPPPVDLKPGR